MIRWTEIELAIAKWLIGATGLARNQVWWIHEFNSRKNPPYITISAPTVRRSGSDWSTYDKTANGDGTFTRRVQGPRTIVVTIQCFAEKGNDATSARAILEDAIAKLQLWQWRRHFRKTRIGVQSAGDVTTLTGSDTFEPRATATIEVNTLSEVTEPMEVIERVEFGLAIQDAGGVELQRTTHTVIRVREGEASIQLGALTCVATGTVT